MKGIVRTFYLKICYLMMVVGLVDWIFLKSIGKQFMLLGMLMGAVLVLYNRLLKI